MTVRSCWFSSWSWWICSLQELVVTRSSFSASYTQGKKMQKSQTTLRDKRRSCCTLDRGPKMESGVRLCKAASVYKETKFPCHYYALYLQPTLHTPHTLDPPLQLRKGFVSHCRVLTIQASKKPSPLHSLYTIAHTAACTNFEIWAELQRMHGCFPLLLQCLLMFVFAVRFSICSFNEFVFKLKWA